MGVKADAAVVADQRREEMLEAAAALIAERGFTETRIADVARRVGASPALVIYYFGTKDTLLTEALRYSEQSFYAVADEMLASTTSVTKRLETLVRLTCVPQTQDEIPGAWGLWFDLWAQAFRHPAVKKDRAELDQQWRDLVARVVHEGVEAAEIAKVDVEEFTVMWAALLDGLVVQLALEDPVVDGPMARRVALEVAHRELGL